MEKEKLNDISFFDWLVGLFKKKPAPIIPEKTYAELAAEAEWNLIKLKYRLEYLQTRDLYFVQYFHNEKWWYLRRWNSDYSLEYVRGNGVRVIAPEHLDSVIIQHQEWIKEGHIFMSFD